MVEQVKGKKPSVSNLSIFAIVNSAIGLLLILASLIRIPTKKLEHFELREGTAVYNEESCQLDDGSEVRMYVHGWGLMTNDTKHSVIYSRPEWPYEMGIFHTYTDYEGVNSISCDGNSVYIGAGRYNYSGLSESMDFVYTQEEIEKDLIYEPVEISLREVGRGSNYHTFTLFPYPFWGVACGLGLFVLVVFVAVMGGLFQMGEELVERRRDAKSQAVEDSKSGQPTSTQIDH